jgi:hypothetical protein
VHVAVQILVTVVFRESARDVVADDVLSIPSLEWCQRESRIRVQIRRREFRIRRDIALMVRTAGAKMSGFFPSRTWGSGEGNGVENDVRGGRNDRGLWRQHGRGTSDVHRALPA